MKKEKTKKVINLNLSQEQIKAFTSDQIVSHVVKLQNLHSSLRCRFQELTYSDLECARQTILELQYSLAKLKSSSTKISTSVANEIDTVSKYVVSSPGEFSEMSCLIQHLK